jgi:hypothetical protein
VAVLVGSEKLGQIAYVAEMIGKTTAADLRLVFLRHFLFVYLQRNSYNFLILIANEFQHYKKTFSVL